MMFNFMILYFILSLLSGLIMKDKKNILACGLVGFYPKRNKQVDLSKLYPLWILNEDRGTHSCGITYGATRRVGINSLSKARDLIVTINKELIDTDLKNLPIICHTRQATAGAHNASNAHPFSWFKGKTTNFFNFAHNGVLKDLYNYKKLLGLSRHGEALMEIDSQVLGLAMFDTYDNTITEEQVLTNYEGNAAFICYDHNNVFKVWKGANNDVEERPMYYVETKEGWYFCSIELSLAICFLQKPIKLDNNTLLTFKNYKLESSVVYYRSVLTSTMALATAKTNAYGFEELVSTKQPSTINTGFKILDNARKLTLDHILKKKDVKTNSQAIVVESYGRHKGKYCIEHLTDQHPLSGIHTFRTDNDKRLIPTISQAGRVLTFHNGVLVKSGMNYTNIQAWFENMVDKKEKTFEDIFNLTYDLVLQTIVDYIPLYHRNELCMIIYKMNDKLDYISINDTITTNIPSVFNFTMKVFPRKLNLHISTY